MTCTHGCAAPAVASASSASTAGASAASGEHAAAKARDAVGRTPLHLAAFGGHGTAVAILLEQGASCTARTRAGLRPSALVTVDATHARQLAASGVTALKHGRKGKPHPRHVRCVQCRLEPVRPLAPACSAVIGFQSPPMRGRRPTPPCYSPPRQPSAP